MALTETDVAPFILVKPCIQLGDNTTGVLLQCMTNQVQAVGDQDDTKTDTFCGSYTSYKAEVWTVTLTALASYGADGLWDQVRPLVGQVIPFVLVPDATQAISIDNPAMWGQARVKVFSFLDANVGEASDFDLVLAVQGQPSFDPPDTIDASLTPPVIAAMTAGPMSASAPSAPAAPPPSE
jgi:hypothetical protein